jgi:hypothetical protein
MGICLPEASEGARVTQKAIQMKTHLVLISAVALLITAIASAEEKSQAQSAAREIPLKGIWAYQMPDTRDMRALEAKSIRESGKALLDPIGVSFVERGERLKWTDLARPAFAVSGSDLDALRNAHHVLVDGTKSREAFAESEDVTLVFFSEPAGPPVQIREVKRTGKDFVIQYRLEPSIDRHRSLSLALIPVGKLKAGKYRVEMEQFPSDHLNAQEGAKLATDIVCKPFSFTVTENGT